MASAVRVGISDVGIADVGIADLGSGIWNRILAADFGPRFQIPDSRFQISDFRFQISK
jgi:hypothetical protein